MAIETNTVLLVVVILQTGYMIARQMGWIQAEELKPMQYDASSDPRNYLISFTHGFRMINAGDFNGPKPEVYLSGMGGEPVYDVIPGVNTFEIDKLKGFFGIENWYLHMNEDDIPKKLKDLYQMGLRERVDELVGENMYLKEENKTLRSNYEEFMKKQSEIIGDIKKKTTPIVIRGGKRGTSDELELDRG